MAHFLGSIQGVSKSSTSRTGTAESGVHAHIRGWNIGVMVEMDLDSEGQDRVTISRTGGSNRPAGYMIASFTSKTPQGTEHVKKEKNS